MSTVTTPGSATPFADHAREVSQQVRRALAEAMSSIGCDPNKPQVVSRQLGLDKTLAWKLCRIVTDDDPYSAIPRLPGKPGVKILLQSLREAGAPGDAVTAVRDAMTEFERLVDTHAGDRETLELMLSRLTKDGQQDRAESHRRLAFQGNSAIWGVQAKAQISLHIMAPDPKSEEALAVATICGLADFRRLRPDVPWSVGALSHWDNGERTNAPIRYEALDTAIAPGSTPLLEQFCSQPLPHLRQVQERNDLTRFVLTEGPVGNTAAATVVFGWQILPPVSRYQSYPGEDGEHGVMLTTPAECVIHDLFIHRSLDFAFNPTGHVYNQLPGGPQYPNENRVAGLLHVPDEVVDLGAGPPDTTTWELPRYREMCEFGVRRLGHELRDFQAYRMRIKYPPMPSLAVLRHRLLQRP